MNYNQDHDIVSLLKLKELHELREWISTRQCYLSDQNKTMAIGITSEWILRQLEAVDYKMNRLKD